jgi:Tfp pilus assembly protein PilF
MSASFASAETALKDAIAFAPDEIDDYVYLAELYTFGGDNLDKRYYEEAIRVAREAVALEPVGPTTIRAQLARALLVTGKVNEGIAELEYILEIDPLNANAALLLAQAYERTGRPDDALAVLRQVETLVPGQPGVAEAIQRLEAGPTP